MKIMCWIGKHDTKQFTRKRRNGDVSVWYECVRCGLTRLYRVQPATPSELQLADNVEQRV